MPWFGRKRKKPKTAAERLASSRNWRAAQAAGNWHQRGFRSVHESRLLRSLVWQHPEMPARTLARRLGCNHSWIHQLRRQFRANFERQRKREEFHGPVTWAEFDAERNKRLGDLRRFVLYRQPRIQRKAPKSEERMRLERQVRTVMRSMRRYERRHGSLDGWQPPS